VWWIGSINSVGTFPRLPEPHLPRLDFVKEKGMSLGNFHKDIDLVQMRLKKTVYDFACGAALIVPNEEAEQRITLENQV